MPFGTLSSPPLANPPNKDCEFQQPIGIGTRRYEMNSDIFGNLMEWGDVLEKLEHIVLGDSLRGPDALRKLHVHVTLDGCL